MSSTAPKPDPSADQREKTVLGRRRRAKATLRRRNRRVEEHRDLVRPLALHYASRCQEPWEDLLQVGLLGLIRAAELYQAEQGTPFEAFARPHIRGAILHYLRDLAPAVRLPRRQAELQERLLRLERSCLSGSEGEASGLRSHLGIDLQNWGLLLRQRQLCRPLPLEEVQLEELAAPESSGGEERLVALAELLQRLDPRERLVVRRVVLGGWSYRRLATQMQISPMTVQRLLQRGLATLRQQLEQAEVSSPGSGGHARSEPRGY